MNTSTNRPPTLTAILEARLQLETDVMLGNPTERSHALMIDALDAWIESQPPITSELWELIDRLCDQRALWQMLYWPTGAKRTREEHISALAHIAPCANPAIELVLQNQRTLGLALWRADPLLETYWAAARGSCDGFLEAQGPLTQPIRELVRLVAAPYAG